MQYDELLDYLQNLIQQKITQKDIGDALGITKQAVGNKKADGYEFKNFEIEKIKNYLMKTKGVQVLSKVDKDLLKSNIIEIPYWTFLPAKLKNPDFTCVTAEKKVIENHWYLKPECLCIVPMIGNKMQDYWYRINDGDILIINTDQNYIMGNGVYFATSRNNSRFWIREMQNLINDDVQIKGFAPSGETTKVFTQEELKAVDFRVIGRVIKNVSFKL